MTQLLILLLSYFSAYITEFSSFQKTSITTVSLNDSTEYIHENYNRDLTLTELLHSNQQIQSMTTTETSLLDNVPVYKGSIHEGEKLTWENSCFKNNTASVLLDKDKGYQLTIEVQSPKNWYCQDWYVLMTSEDMSFNIINSKGIHIIKKRKWDGVEEFNEARTNGIRIFTFEGRFAELFLF